MGKLREWAHSFIAVLGVLIAAQGTIVPYLVSLTVPERALDLGFAGAGLVVTILSKAIDSNNDAAKNAPRPPVV